LEGTLVGTRITAVALQFYSVVMTHLNEYRIILQRTECIIVGWISLLFCMDFIFVPLMVRAGWERERFPSTYSRTPNFAEFLGPQIYGL